jgi:hypothetical protein
MANIQVTHDTSLNNARSESTVAINPNNGQQIVAASKKFSNIQNYDFTTAIEYSGDGGQTWQESAALVIPANATVMGDPVLTWDDSDNVFLVTLTSKDPPQGVLVGIVIYASTDFGATWSAPNNIHLSSGDDKPWLAADCGGSSAHKGNLYAVWDDLTASGMAFARTTDHGSTWIGAAGTPLGSTILTGTLYPEITVSDDGTVYVVSIEEAGGVIRMLTSGDGGNTFPQTPPPASGVTTLVAALPPVDGRAVFPGGTFRLITDPTVAAYGNTVLVAWADYREGVSRIYYARSTDGGSTWLTGPSGQTLLTGSVPSNLQHFFPQLVVDPNGVFGCVFYEFGPKPTTMLIDVILTHSVNDGVSFAIPVTVTDEPWDPTVDAPWSDGDPKVTFIGDYMALDASATGFYPVWTDTRTGMQELWTASPAPLSAPPVATALEFWVSKSTFGVDEVTDSKTWTNAFALVLEGFAPYQLGTPLLAPQFSGAFYAFPGVKITPNASGPRWQDPGLTYTPQRLEFPFDISFTTASLASFPALGAAALDELLEASITAAGNNLQAKMVIELVSGADPYFTNINATADNEFWLSQDLRVFTATPGIHPTPVVGLGTPPPLVPTDYANLDPAAGYAYAKALIAYLNAEYSDPSAPDPLASILPSQTGALSGDSSVNPHTPNPQGGVFANYNFAIARVRLRGAQGTSAANVKVFFRLFLTQTNDTDFQPTTTYRSTPSFPALPESPEVGTNETTIPFFATGTLTAQTDYGAGGVNNQTVAISTGDSVWAYFGCFLNVYDPNNIVNHKPVGAWLQGTHHCLVAQIAYDAAPIENSNGVTMSPENSDKLAQRNLQVTPSDNPGPLSGHRVPQTFDLRPSRTPSPIPGANSAGPDELMINWGATPLGAIASIYWPQLNAAGVIALADTLYAIHSLTASDPHTIQTPVTNGVSYIPIPPGSGENIAGLFTVDLPDAIVSGQEFDIVIRRVAHRTQEREAQKAPTRGKPRRTRASAARTKLSWRYVVGTFQVKIPVATGEILLGREENTLAILKWRLLQTPASDRWHPVLKRYIGYVESRVDAFGGKGAAVPASPTGYRPPPRRPRRAERCIVGKVIGVRYNRFGDFEGFAVLSEDGYTFRFDAAEHEIESLVRQSWLARYLIEVRTHEHQPRVPVSIVLLRAHRHGDLWLTSRSAP